jgi:hypothetical protein
MFSFLLRIRLFSRNAKTLCRSGDILLSNFILFFLNFQRTFYFSKSYIGHLAMRIQKEFIFRIFFYSVISNLVEGSFGHFQPLATIFFNAPSRSLRMTAEADSFPHLGAIITEPLTR